MNTKLKYLALSTTMLIAPVKTTCNNIINNSAKTINAHFKGFEYPFVNSQRAEAFGLFQSRVKMSAPSASMDVSKTRYTGSPELLNQFLGGVLKGKGNAFCKAQEKYGVNALFLIGIAKHESGNGTSKIARERCNVAGMKGKHGWMRFSSVEECIDKMAKNIKENYIDQNKRTVSQINRKYAKDTSWSSKILRFMKEIYAEWTKK